MIKRAYGIVELMVSNKMHGMSLFRKGNALHGGRKNRFVVVIVVVVVLQKNQLPFPQNMIKNKLKTDSTFFFFFYVPILPLLKSLT